MSAKRPPRVSAEEQAKRRPLPPVVLLAAPTSLVLPQGRLIRAQPLKPRGRGVTRRNGSRKRPSRDSTARDRPPPTEATDDERQDRARRERGPIRPSRAIRLRVHHR